MNKEETCRHLLNVFDRFDTITDYVQRAGLRALSAEEQNRHLRRSRRVCSAITHIRRYTLENPDGMPMSELARRMRMTPSAATHMVDSMDRQGMIERRASHIDRRSVLVQLTEEFNSNSAMVEGGLVAAGQRLHDALTPEECVCLNTILEKLVGVVREEG